MQFGLQHPSFSFDYKNQDASQITDTLNNIVTKAENAGFDSFWVMDHFHQIPGVGKPEEPMLESWTTLSFLAFMRCLSMSISIEESGLGNAYSTAIFSMFIKSLSRIGWRLRYWFDVLYDFNKTAKASTMPELSI